MFPRGDHQTEPLKRCQAGKTGRLPQEEALAIMLGTFWAVKALSFFVVFL